MKYECTVKGDHGSFSCAADKLADMVRAIIICWSELEPEQEEYLRDCHYYMTKHLHERGEEAVKQELAELRQSLRTIAPS